MTRSTFTLICLMLLGCSAETVGVGAIAQLDYQGRVERIEALGRYSSEEAAVLFQLAGNRAELTIEHDFFIYRVVYPTTGVRNERTLVSGLVAVPATVLAMILSTPAASAAAGDRDWSFFGGFTWHELSNPGGHLGAEYVLAGDQRLKSLTAASLQLYHEQGVETGYAVQLRWGQRYLFAFGLTFESFLGIAASTRPGARRCSSSTTASPSRGSAAARGSPSHPTSCSGRATTSSRSCAGRFSSPRDPA